MIRSIASSSVGHSMKVGPIGPPSMVAWRSRFDLSRHFAVVVHDVAPVFRPQLVAILDALSAKVAGKLLGAVVPCWDGLALGSRLEDAEADFLQMVGSSFGEVLQHGYTHRQLKLGLISLLSGRSNELSGLSLNETRHRLRLGREILVRTLGIAVDGFIPPAWQVAHATMAELSRLGFRYVNGFGAIRVPGSEPIPLATWSWDWGLISPLGHFGEWYGNVSSRVRPDALPCVVVHPHDVDRGYLPRVVRVVDGLLRQGRTPLTFSELVLVPASTMETSR